MHERLPESRLVFQDITRDGLLTLTVWIDDSPQTDLMRENGVEAMGNLRIYNNVSASLQHEERVPLSHDAIFGPGPIQSEADYWDSLINQFYTDYD